MWSCSASAKSLWGMLMGRFLVGTGMGIGPPVTALYVSEVWEMSCILWCHWLYQSKWNFDFSTLIRFHQLMLGALMGAALRLQHVLDFWVLFLLVSLPKKFRVGKRLIHEIIMVLITFHLHTFYSLSVYSFHLSLKE